jgi:hypothetical protein
VRAKTDFKEGEMIVRFKVSKVSPFYSIEKTAPSVNGNVDTSNWINVGLTSRQKIIATSINSRSILWFQSKSTCTKS